MSNTMSNDAKNSSSDAKAIVGSVLGIEDSAAWDIISSDPDFHLFMAHHKPEANLTEHGQIRGVVIDTQAKAVVAKSYGYTPTVHLDSLEVNAGTLNLVDETGTSHSIPLNLASITTGFEGTLISVFKHGGIVRRVTRKRLDPGRSRWGNSKPFIEMYWDLGGPTDEDLFHPHTDYSPWCHNFIIVHPQVQIVSKDNVGPGYLVYLGPKQLWTLDRDECPYKQLDLNNELFEGVSQEVWDADSRPSAGWIDDTLMLPAIGQGIVNPPDLTLAEANKHLRFGFYDSFDGWETMDQRMLPGEFLVISWGEDKEHSIRIESTSYQWRMAMRDNNPNLLHQFFKLVTSSYLRYNLPEEKERYNHHFPDFTPYDEESIIGQITNDGPYVVWPQDPEFHQSEHLMTKESRMFNIWLAFLNVVPIQAQLEVSQYLGYLYKSRGALISWLRHLESKNQLDHTTLSKRTINIIETARNYSTQKISSGSNIGYNGKKLGKKALTRQNIKNLVMKERGDSLYKLIREMDRYNNPQ